MNWDEKMSACSGIRISGTSLSLNDLRMKKNTVVVDHNYKAIKITLQKA